VAKLSVVSKGSRHSLWLVGAARTGNRRAQAHKFAAPAARAVDAPESKEGEDLLVVTAAIRGLQQPATVTA